MARRLKDSGIPWIGAIPEEWEVIRLRRIFSEAHEKTLDESGQLLTLSQYTGISPKSYEKKAGMFEAESTIGYNVVHAGQFVMNIMLAWNGSYGVSNYNGIISPAYVVFNFNIDCSKKYFHYLLRLEGYPQAFKTVSRGIIDSRLRLYPIYFYQFLTILPPKDEQERIAAYLDRKCGEIDELIEVEQQMISDLEAYRQAVITEAVTKGLNPEVEMKDSGVYWIGDIPMNWNIRKISSLFHGIGSGTTPTSGNPLYYSDEGYHWLQTGDLNDSIIKQTSKKITNIAIQDFSTLKLYPKGSIVIAMYGATIGKLGLLAIETATNQACCVLPYGADIYNKFAFYAFRAGKQALINASYGGGQPNISQETIKQFLIALPPLSEQQQIADYLDAKCAEIDSLIKVKQEKIETLKEYRQSLIFEAVTGKIEVQ